MNEEVNDINDINMLLENEQQKNKIDSWNKIDKTMKIQKLHKFAEKYGRESGLPVKEIKALKQFFIQCLDNNKLLKTKDVSYDKEKQEINSIPALFFNTSQKKFTLRLHEKHVSTLKSLTPKRLTEKNKKTKEDIENIVHEKSDISGNTDV